jgi:hypothetical protein
VGLCLFRHGNKHHGREHYFVHAPSPSVPRKASVIGPRPTSAEKPHCSAKMRPRTRDGRSALHRVRPRRSLAEAQSEPLGGMFRDKLLQILRKTRLCSSLTTGNTAAVGQKIKELALFRPLARSRTCCRRRRCRGRRGLASPRPFELGRPAA